MTAIPPPTQQTSGSFGQGQQLQPGQPQQTAQKMPPGGQMQQPSGQQGLPPTGLQQQLQSLQGFYSQVQNAQLGQGPNAVNIGFNPYQYQAEQAQALPGQGALQNGGIVQSQQPQQNAGQTSIQQMGNNLAQRYGLPLGRGGLFDEYGNPTVSPDQLAAASGGSLTVGMAAAKLQFVQQAIANRQNQQQQQKGIAALSQGLGQVQSRGRGSLAALQSPFYSQIADMYANQEYDTADFSSFIEAERTQFERELASRQEAYQKKAARAAFITGIVGVIAAPFTGGASLALAGGIAQGGNTGWF